MLFIVLTDTSSAGSVIADPKLSVIEIEAIMREKVRAKCTDLQQVLQGSFQLLYAYSAFALIIILLLF